MPSTTPKQRRVMSAIAHGWRPTGSAAKIPVKVAKEFHAADAGKKWGASKDTGGAVLEPIIDSPTNPLGGILSTMDRIHQERKRREADPEIEKKRFGGGLRPMHLMRLHPMHLAPAMASGGVPWVERMAYNKLNRAPANGFINSTVPGRTDKHGIQVAAGSYVLPADHVSALGQNNSAAGAAAIRRMFGAGGKFGSKIKTPKFAAGGGVETVPIVVAGGEVILPPDIVKRVGDGDVSRGHDTLDKWVLDVRKKHIEKLKSLKPPKKG